MQKRFLDHLRNGKGDIAKIKIKINKFLKQMKIPGRTCMLVWEVGGAAAANYGGSW